MLTGEDVDDIRDWWDGERDGDSAGSMLGRLDATVAVIVRRHVAAALTEAADFIRDTAGIGASGNNYAQGWYAALDYAIGELRNRASP